MRALICRAWGDIDTLELAEVPAPVPGAGEVLIDVVSSSANFADSIMVAGNYQTKPAFPFAPGLEAAGRIRAVGAGVENLKPGDAVMAKLAHGGFAEQAVAEAGETWPLFEGMDFGKFKPEDMSSDEDSDFYSEGDSSEEESDDGL